MAKNIKSDELGDPSTDVSTRLAKIDHDWLMENRGSKSLREKEHEVIECYKKQRLKEAIFQLIRMLPEKTVLKYQQICEVFPSEHPENVCNALKELLTEARIAGSVREGFRVS